MDVYALDGEKIGELFTGEQTRFVTPKEYKEITKKENNAS